MADDYMTQLASLTGLRHCPKQGPFGDKAGAVIGERDGYILVIGPGKAFHNDKKAAINIMVRFREAQPGGESLRAAAESLTMPADVPPTPLGGEVVRAAVAAHPAVAAALGVSEFSGKHHKQMDLGRDYLTWSWDYSFGKPKADGIVALANALLDAVKSSAPALASKCEICNSNTVSEILLCNGIPGYFCTGCQETTRYQLDEASRAYEVVESHFGRGLIFGVVAALLGSIAWGGVAYAIKRIFLWGGVVIGYFIGWAFFKGSGKVDNFGRITVAVLTVLSVLFGDVIFYALIVSQETGTPLSVGLFLEIIANFWAIEKESQGGIASIVFALIGAGVYLYSVRKPKFAVQYEPLASPSK